MFETKPYQMLLLICQFPDRMASSSSGSEAVLAGNDPVADKLLSHVSHYVIGRVRKQFATGPLGLRDEQYDNIEEDYSTAERRNYEVNNPCP